MTKKTLGVGFYALLAFAYYFLFFPIRNCAKESQIDSEFFRDYSASKDSIFVTVTEDETMLYLWPKESNKTKILGYLKDYIRADSVEFEIRKFNKSVNGFYYISFTNQNWFYFYETSFSKLSGAWVESYRVSKTRKVGLRNYIRYLRRDSDASHPTFFRSHPIKTSKV